MYKNRERRKLKIILILILLIGFITINFSVSKYRLMITENGEAMIARPIIIFEKDESINKNYSKKTGELNYFFKIKNYKEDMINEIDFSYEIEIIENNNKFPVEYTLIDLSNNKEIELISNKTSSFKIGSNIKEEDSYMLKINWHDKDIDEYSDRLELAVKANIVQIYK